MELDVFDQRMKCIADDKFLAQLVECAKNYGWVGDYVEIKDFIQHLYLLNDKECPDLTPYDK